MQGAYKMYKKFGAVLFGAFVRAGVDMDGVYTRATATGTVYVPPGANQRARRVWFNAAMTVAQAAQKVRVVRHAKACGCCVAHTLEFP